MRLSLASALAILILTSAATAADRSASSAELVFTRVEGDRYSVWVAGADGSGAREVVDRASNGTLSSDGRWLTYSRLRYTRYGEQFRGRFVVNLAGGTPRRIRKVAAEEWAPERAALAIADETSLYVLDPVSGARRELVRGRHIHSLSFSPDGGAIAFTWSNVGSGAGYRSDVFSVRLSDGRVRRLTYDGHSASPLWGPDWIVYERYRWGGGIGRYGRLWLMRRDGSGKRFFARGAEGLLDRLPVYGLVPLALSEDGRRLLACQAFEFGCRRVTFTVPGGERYGFPKLSPLERKHGASAEDLSPDGARVLVDVGSPHDVREHALYEVPFEGGKPRRLVRNAIQASWRR